MSRYMTDTCECGASKDRRSRKCRGCFETSPTNEKLCRRCNRTLPITDFGTRPSNRKDHQGSRPRAHCKGCDSEEAAKYTQAHPEYVADRKRDYNATHPVARKRWSRRSGWRANGMDPDIVEQFIAAHHGRCDICGDHPDDVGTLHVDHDHVTLELRGLLCSRCNVGLGQFRDDPTLLEAAINYLQRLGPVCAGKV